MLIHTQGEQHFDSQKLAEKVNTPQQVEEHPPTDQPFKDEERNAPKEEVSTNLNFP